MNYNDILKARKDITFSDISMSQFIIVMSQFIIVAGQFVMVMSQFVAVRGDLYIYINGLRSR